MTLENKNHSLTAEKIENTHQWAVTDSSEYERGTYRAEVEYLSDNAMILFWRNKHAMWVGWRTDTGRCTNNVELSRVLAELK